MCVCMHVQEIVQGGKDWEMAIMVKAILKYVLLLKSTGIIDTYKVH